MAICFSRYNHICLISNGADLSYCKRQPHVGQALLLGLGILRRKGQGLMFVLVEVLFSERITDHKHSLVIDVNQSELSFTVKHNETLKLLHLYIIFVTVAVLSTTACSDLARHALAQLDMPWRSCILSSHPVMRVFCASPMRKCCPCHVSPGMDSMLGVRGLGWTGRTHRDDFLLRPCCRVARSSLLMRASTL